MGVRTRLSVAMIAVAVLTAPAVATAPSAGAIVGAITEFPDGVTPIGITNGPDNNLYIAEHRADQIGKMAYNGRYPIPPFPVPTRGSGPFHITQSFEYNTLYYTELNGSAIGRVTVTGTVLPDIPTPTPNSGPLDIRKGPDGAMWFTENFAGKVGRISPRACGTTGDYCVTQELTIPTPGSGPGDIAVGPDNNMWFTETNTGKIGRVNLSTYRITEFPLPNAASRPEGIVTGPDGNVWFTEHDANRVGKMSPSGVLLAEYDRLTGRGPTNIIVGPDNNLWFPEEFNPGPDPTNLPPGDKIGRITTSGALTEYTTPTSGSRPVIVTAGRDGNIWFTEVFAGQVGRLSLH
jgi:virginiamycin B lyase